MHVLHVFNSGGRVEFYRKLSRKRKFLISNPCHLKSGVPPLGHARSAFVAYQLKRFSFWLLLRAMPNHKMGNSYVKQRPNGGQISQKALHVPFPIQWG